MLKTVIYVFLGLLLGGCVLQTGPQQVIPSQSTMVKPASVPQRVHSEPAVVKSSVAHHGMIRGVIMEQIYNPDKKVWVYEIKAIDAANDKLKSASFIHDKRVHHKGDLVYAIIKYGSLQEIYLIKTAYHKTPSRLAIVKKASVPVKEKVQKRTKSRQTPWISVPKEENISLE